jgi:2,4-dienoyl-CoA reductase-like NADH-dependent reductase (Old Yellow Enzyme family)/thioredoxin reductase
MESVTESLFEPVRIGRTELANRIVFPPMTTGFEAGGIVSEKSLAFYSRIAEGGASLIVLGDCSIQKSFAPTPYIYDDTFLEGLRELTARVHERGAKIAAQLFHQEYDTGEVLEQMKQHGREAAMKKLHSEMEEYVNRISHKQIAAIQEKFVAAAIRAEKSGFDLIQLHGDRLFGMFTSPLMNRRGDAYGGSPENRMRFVLETVKKIREALPDMPLEYKMAVIRTDPPMGRGGPPLPEARQLAAELEAAGVDAFHVALANHGSIAFTIPPMGTAPFGCFLDLARGIKEAVKVPVTAVGRITDPALAGEIIQRGDADLVAVGRGLMADPDWPAKAKENRREAIRYCIMCNHCTDCLMQRRAIRCAINPALDPDLAASAPPAAERKRVLVVGGGPAGMQAAAAAADKGHSVVLIEKAPELGGQLNIAAKPKFKQEMAQIRDFLIKALQHPRIEVCTCTAFSPEAIERFRPDEIVVAAGARPAADPDIEPSILEKAVLAWDVLAEKTEVSGSVAIFGGAAVGLETGIWLAERGRSVHICYRSEMELREKLVQEQKSKTLIPYIEKTLAQYRIQVWPGVLPTAWGDGHLELRRADGETLSVACDELVIATGAVPNSDVIADPDAYGIPVTFIGDCRPDAPGTVQNAILEGYQTGRTL